MRPSSNLRASLVQVLVVPASHMCVCEFKPLTVLPLPSLTSVTRVLTMFGTMQLGYSLPTLTIHIEFTTHFLLHSIIYSASLTSNAVIVAVFLFSNRARILEPFVL